MVVLSLSKWVYAAAPATDDRVEPPGAGETETLHGNVLVWADAALYTEPSDTAMVIHAASLHGARKDNAGQVVPMHVVSCTKDGYVEVEPVDEVDCAWSQLETADDLTRVRLFVKRTDIAPVVVDHFTKTFDNGTRVALRPGVPVVPTASGAYQLGVHGAGEIVIELPATSVGHAYTPDKTKALATADHEYELTPKTQVTLGDRTMVIGAHASAIEKHGDTTLFSIQTRCVALDVNAPSRAVHAIDEDETTIESGSGLGVLDLRDRDYIPAGTPLSTPSGHAIAVAAKPIYLLAAPRGKTACVDRRVRVSGDALEPQDGDDKLRVCAPAGRVLHERVRSPSSGTGTTRR